MTPSSRTYIAGHRGFVGSAIASQASDVARLNAMGWRHRISLEEGIRATYNWYLSRRSPSGNRGRIAQMPPAGSPSGKLHSASCIS